MRATRERTLALLAFLLLALSGCAADLPDPPTIQSWQQNLAKYVRDRGNGDPNVIADMSWDDVHRGFAVIGDPLPQRSTDQLGLLVGHKLLGGKPHFIFLLATVRQQTLESLRAVALQVDGDAFHWTVGVDDPKSLSVYRAWSQADRARDGPSNPAPPPFPRPQDTFELIIAREQFVILHRESGARWEVRPLLLPATRSAEPSG